MRKAFIIGTYTPNFEALCTKIVPNFCRLPWYVILLNKKYENKLKSILDQNNMKKKSLFELRWKNSKIWAARILHSWSLEKIEQITS